MALIKSMFLTGCASVRGPARLMPLQETPAVEPANQSWDAVVAIPLDSPLEVGLDSGERMRGRLRSADDRELVLDQDGTLRRVPRTEIWHVLINRGSHAGRGTLLGLGIGAGTGFATGLSLSLLDSDVSNHFMFVLTATIAALGTGIGALIGALVPEWTVIYETPVPETTN